MDLDPSIEPSVFIIVILVMVLIILFIFHLIKKKSQMNTNECSCSTKPVSEPKNDDKKTQSNVIALYYSNGCIHSKTFLPTWNELKEKIKSGELGSTVTSNEYECSEDKNECAKNKIDGVPSMILHKASGESINYPSNRPRTVESIKEFVMTQLK